jgi:large subunit ribosomal protein L18
MSVKRRERRQAWLRRKQRVRKSVTGSEDRPRLSIFRSNKNIYAQIVNDMAGRTLVALSTRKLPPVEVPEKLTGKCALAYQVGRGLADQAKEQGIAKIVFDRSGYLYHGRIAALARGVRDGGIEF